MYYAVLVLFVTDLHVIQLFLSFLLLATWIKPSSAGAGVEGYWRLCLGLQAEFRDLVLKQSTEIKI